MKFVFLTFALFFLTANSFAFKSEPKDSVTKLIDKTAALLIIDQGKQLLLEGKVRDALTVFREAGIKDPNTWKAPYWVSYCHYKLSNFGYSKQYGVEAVKKGEEEVDKDIYFIIGSCFHQLASLDTAIIYYETAKKLLSPSKLKDLRIDQRIAECNFARLELNKTANKRVLMRGEVNSGFNEYGPILVNNGKRMYFTSRRGNTTGGKINPDDQEYFEDVYTAVWNPTTQLWDSISNKIDRMNTDGFDALSWISNDGLKAIVTLNNTATASKVLTKSSDICEIEFTKKGKWTAAKPIVNKSINSTYFDGAATLTADGNTMYFVSDRKGDTRSTDIYMVQKVGKTWGQATLLPDSINSLGRETTPYITPDGRFLFFSSDGRAGMGGLDIYVVENTGSGWGSPKNLGGSINSVNDETHLKIYKDLNKIVFSGSNLSGQKSSIDIYEIELSSIILPIKM